MRLEVDLGCALGLQIADMGAEAVIPGCLGGIPAEGSAWRRRGHVHFRRWRTGTHRFCQTKCQAIRKKGKRSGMEGSAKAAAGVQAISERLDLEPQEKIKRLLACGNDLFKTASALVSNVRGSRYVVMYCVSDEVEVDPGTEFGLGDTYCVHTLNAKAPLAFHKASSSEIAGHPCYEMFRLETYIGAPIKIGGTAWGTVNFSAIEAREPFAPQDLQAMAALSEAVGRELVAAGQAA
ncbi:GAF domain-containing protein [Leisingera daeponensis]|uniref:GAF domain-containing protein n=1 Tax=Leisingera daeponensis TaxID=405746 RepID=A0ABS7NEG5_9RHOB|nr:GAF domain-containing protein [Leisingera daeponensis]MBY6139256.1 GAF domain-containing protein [Leisingera daeponensis]